jgi:hypothetical protein
MLSTLGALSKADVIRTKAGARHVLTLHDVSQRSSVRITGNIRIDVVSDAVEV